MAWEKFTKKETKDKESWVSAKVSYMDSVSVDSSNDWYFRIEGKKHILPIQNICRATRSQEEEEYLLNNREVAIILKPTGKIRKFFRIPSVIPETLTYYSKGLVAGISKTREEVVSFTVGGPFADSEFSIANYTVSARLDDCEDIYAEDGLLYALYAEGVCVMEPIEI
ncbi:hypothetical protein NEMIN01_0711 [Nematocida minor]|uniref:uncharacterized protein n=1 Tax=Nematocida minor TaxID=1912983 RepID=UPI002221089D|nr:uncharacterized protein NEMIN01_0711 [Nematocida minor]KAI5189848.1 hypothetical protein NEMIN01_0711 [Nematocida minor]